MEKTSSYKCWFYKMRFSDGNSIVKEVIKDYGGKKMSYGDFHNFIIGRVFKQFEYQ